MVKILTGQAAKQGRVARDPEHTFQVRHKPWIIQPIMIAPVLPGETFKQLMLQSRVVSEPVKNPLIGWWIEYYFYYIPLRALAGRDVFESMMLDAELDTSSLNSAAKAATYHYATSPDYVQMCLDAVVAKDFRSPSDAGSHNIDSMPLAAVNVDNWTDSAVNDDDFVGPIDVDVDGPDANTTVQASEVDKALRTWQILRAQQLTDQTFEDYLATFGVRPRVAADALEPELIRYIRNWTYPTNTINPETGAPSSAISWSVAERADKDRFCREPGFIFGVTVARPKVYFSNLKGAAVSAMTSVMEWLPAIMRDDPYTSLRKFASGTGPLGANTDDYWFDVKDLFLYGDQFVNFSLAATDAGMVALPTAGLDKRYVTDAMIEALFVGEDPTCLVRQDGICKLTVMGSLRDTTPPISAFGV